VTSITLIPSNGRMPSGGCVGGCVIAASIVSSADLRGRLVAARECGRAFLGDSVYETVGRPVV
jgi:hypothetical protein